MSAVELERLFRQHLILNALILPPLSSRYSDCLILPSSHSLQFSFYIFNYCSFSTIAFIRVVPKDCPFSSLSLIHMFKKPIQLVTQNGWINTDYLNLKLNGSYEEFYDLVKTIWSSYIKGSHVSQLTRKTHLLKQAPGIGRELIPLIQIWKSLNLNNNWKFSNLK